MPGKARSGEIRGAGGRKRIALSCALHDSAADAAVYVYDNGKQDKRAR